MELKQMKELMAAMGRTGMKRLMLKKESFELVLERDESGVVRLPDLGLDLGDESPQNGENSRRAAIALSRAKDSSTALAGTVIQSDSVKEGDIPSLFVTSPMVGTFYSSPSPDEASFVKIGDKVEKGSVVCIVEAMKVMNEVKAGVAGTVGEALIETGHPVEFGTKLFRIIPNTH